MRSRLQLKRRPGVEPTFVLTDVSFSLMFAMAMFVKSSDGETIEVPLMAPPAVPANASAPSPDVRPVVKIDMNGVATINGQETSDEALVEFVRQLMPSSPAGSASKVTIRLEGHQKVEYGRLFAVRDLLQRAGFDILEVGKVP